MQGKSLFLVIGLLLVLVIANASIYVVQETERAVLLRFGEVEVADIKPGLHVKIPVVNKVRKFDGRLLTLDARAERFLTIEKKALIVDSYAKWKIANVEKYYQATNGEEIRTQGLLAQLINDGLRNEVGERDLHEVVSGKRDELMEELTGKINEQALRDYGVEVVDIRVKQVDLPKDVSQSVYNRMNTEREKEAREHRSQGKELAEGIRAAADREKVIIEANAYRDAEQLRGEGEAKSAAIYAEAYNKNPEFYAFWRSLQAYEKSFAHKSDVLLLKPDNEFFRYLNTSNPKK
jgi:membrane protease subunit HflC